MYKSPIEIIYKDVETKLENDVLKAVQQVGIKVDKQELIKALECDRDTYIDGYNDALYEMRIKLTKVFDEMRLKP